MWWLYVKLFYSFFKIGLFGFGGGYAMISLIQGEVVNRYLLVEAHRRGEPDLLLAVRQHLSLALSLVRHGDRKSVV